MRRHQIVAGVIVAVFRDQVVLGQLQVLIVFRDFLSPRLFLRFFLRLAPFVFSDHRDKILIRTFVRDKQIVVGIGANVDDGDDNYNGDNAVDDDDTLKNDADASK